MILLQPANASLAAILAVMKATKVYLGMLCHALSARLPKLLWMPNAQLLAQRLQYALSLLSGKPFLKSVKIRLARNVCIIYIYI